MNPNIILPISDPQADLAAAGGKGASLSRLCGAGLPVPGGFHITTAAYQAFVGENDLQAGILASLPAAGEAQPDSFEAASRAIQSRFRQGRIPAEIAAAITQAYAALPGEQPAVAVRSSATAEDLPDASFAGQQDTYLNIRGEAALLEAVKNCWASLWTARAIAYRDRNRIDPAAVALAVVVQVMAPADAAGILFTANPLNGRRDEILINAAWGLGEAVVSGAVTPDTVVLQKKTAKILRRETAAKQVMTVRAETGTREAPVPADRQSLPVLDDARAAELARLGERIEALYGMPMDVEWALANGQFAILQARPITSLPPEWVRPHPRAVYARGSLAEHLPNPVTPLFATLGLRAANQATAELGQTLHFDAESAEYQYRSVNGYVYMGFVTTPVIFWRMIRGSFAALSKMFTHTRERWLTSSAELDVVMARWSAAVETTDSLRALPAQMLLEGAFELFTQVGRLYTVLQSGPLPAATSSEVIFKRVYRMVQRKGDPEGTMFLYGFDTLPLKAEKALYDLAQWAGQQPELASALRRMPVDDLSAALQAPQAPEGLAAEVWLAWRERFEDYLRQYGGMVYDLDFARPTPAERPEPALEAIQMYLNGQGQNPYERQRAAVELREQSTQGVLARLRWPVKGWFRKALDWAQGTGPVREDCLADLGKAHPLVRRMLGEVGRRLAEGGAIAGAEEVYWLEEQEAASVCAQLDQGQRLTDLRGTVDRRKADWKAQVKLTPPAMLPERTAWTKIMPWHQTDQGGNILKGYGASTGRITAPACVLLSPEDFGKMKPGAVLVAVNTTPAWTPLFAMASAVVTDIGGPLSHGSIVAREYGIPAVMAAGLATRRIHDGQIITVDGGAGLIILQENGSGNGKPAA